MAQEDDLQDLDSPDPTETGTEGEQPDNTPTPDATFTDLNETMPPKDAASESPRPRRNDPERRINKLVSQNKALADELRAEREARAQEKAKLAEYESRQTEQSATALESKIKELRVRRDKAFEEGDLATYHDLEDEYLDAKVELKDIRKSRPASPEPPDPQDKPQPRASEQPQATTAYPEATMNWVARNKAWYDGKPNNPKVAKANEVFQALVAEGYDPSEDDLYEVLDERLAEERPRPIAGGPRNGNEGRPNRQSGINKDDFPLMRKWGYDPNKPEDRKRWLSRNQDLG
jgi:hypothetical protein